MNIKYTPVGQLDQASHHFHEHPKEQAERGQVCVHCLMKTPQMKKVLNVHSLQLQRLQDAPSHQADHEGPVKEWERSLII